MDNVIFEDHFTQYAISASREYQEIHPYSAVYIYSVKINTSLIMMKEWLIHIFLFFFQKQNSSVNDFNLRIQLPTNQDDWKIPFILYGIYHIMQLQCEEDLLLEVCHIIAVATFSDF